MRSDLFSFATSARYGASSRQGPHHWAQTLMIIGLPRSPASRTWRPPPRHGNTTSGKPEGTGVTFESDVGQSAMPAAFFMAARVAVDCWAGSTTLGDSTGVVERASTRDPLQPATTIASTAAAAARDALIIPAAPESAWPP